MIVAVLASMPERTPYLEKVVEAIRPQVDALRVYLNNFDEIPPFLTQEEGRLSSEALGDLGDSGKFYWFDGREDIDHSHYLTLDDDLGYPGNYVSTMVHEFDARDRKAVVGVHGSTLLQPIKDFVTSRDERFRFYQGLERARKVHLLGTATTLLSRDTLDLTLDNFSSLRNAADLHLAIAAQRQSVPMIAVARPEQWITEERPWQAEGYSIWKAVRNHSSPQTLLASSAIHSWRLFNDPLQTKINDIEAANDKRSLFAENAPLGTFDEEVEAVNSEKSGKLFFVVVGAMDGVNHDKLHKHIIENRDWSGLLIEPLPDMFAKLRQNFAGRSNLFFENSAITTQEGTADITRIPAENVDQECPPWSDGLSTLRPEIHIIGKQESLKAFAVTQPVTTTRFESLVKKYQLAAIDILQIDAEGYDKEIFDQIWAANFRPNLIHLFPVACHVGLLVGKV
jgi:FkbM family methyltransferase